MIRRRVVATFAVLPLTISLLNCVADEPTVGEGTDNDASSNADVTQANDGGPSGDSASDASTGTPINGTVLENNGAPMPNAKVRLGASTVVTTDSNGVFTFADAPDSYDLDVVPPSLRVKSYRGLTTRTPTIHVTGMQEQSTLDVSESNLTLGYDGGGMDDLEVTFVSGPTSSDFSSSTSTTHPLTWFGPTTLTGTAVGLVRFIATSGQIVSVRGKPATAPLTVNANTTATVALTYADAPQGTIGLTLGGTNPSYVTATLHDPTLPAAGVEYLVNALSGSPTSISLPTFDYAGATYDVGVAFAPATNEQITIYQYGLSPNATGNLFEELLAPGVHLTSENLTSVTTSTLFTWSTTPGTFEFQAYCLNGSNPITELFTLFTTATSATIPDLSAQGAPLMSGA